MKTFLILMSVVFYLIGIADFCGMFFNYDFTGVSWSPIAFFGIGYLCNYCSGNKDDNAIDSK